MATAYLTNIAVRGPYVLCCLLVIAASVLPGCTSARSTQSRDDNPVRCSTISPPPNQRLAIERNLRTKALNAPIERAPGSVTIPVHFHVIRSSSNGGAVPQTALVNQIRVLNEAFAGRGPGGNGAPTPFTFVLESVEETVNDAWFNMEYRFQPTPAEIQAKTQLNRGGRSALNIYTIRIPSRPFGWSRFPWDPENVQGVVIDFRTLPGGSRTSYNLGDTATHEVGHWLGLFHTFENGCNGLGDEVRDTPPELGPTTMCPPAPDSCPGNGRDSIHNFMNFTTDQCMFQFTTEQARRMDLMHQAHRSQ